MTSPTAPKFRQVQARPIDVSDDELLKFSGEMGVPTLVKADPVDTMPPAPQLKSAAATPPVASALPGDRPSKSKPRTDKKAKQPVIEPEEQASERLTLDVPLYVADQIRRRVYEQRCSARYIVLSALKKAGFDVESRDLVPNLRRSRPKR